MQGLRSTRRVSMAVAAVAAALRTATITSCIKVTPEGNAAFVDVLARDVRGGQAPWWVRDDALQQLAAAAPGRRSSTLRSPPRTPTTPSSRSRSAPCSAIHRRSTRRRRGSPSSGPQGTRATCTSLLASDDLYAQAGGTNAAIVDRVAELTVGQPLGEAPRAAAIALLDAGGSRSSFARSQWTSAEAAEHPVDATYQRLLARAPSVAERARWTDALTSQDTSASHQRLAASDEYYADAAKDLAAAWWSTPRGLRVGTVGVPVDSELAAFGGDATLPVGRRWRDRRAAPHRLDRERNPIGRGEHHRDAHRDRCRRPHRDA